MPILIGAVNNRCNTDALWRAVNSLTVRMNVGKSEDDHDVKVLSFRITLTLNTDVLRVLEFAIVGRLERRYLLAAPSHHQSDSPNMLHSQDRASRTEVGVRVEVPCHSVRKQIYVPDRFRQKVQSVQLTRSVKGQVSRVW